MTNPGAVTFYLRRHRVTAGTSDTIPDAAYAAWLDDIRAGRDSVLLTTSSSTVTTLNARARADLVLAGKVDVDGIPLRDGTAAAVGDRVVTRRNMRRLVVHGGRDWVKNGDGWQVIATHPDGALTVVHRKHSGKVTLPADYVAEQVELDYARTVRRAQGITVDRAHLLVDPGMCREDLYVGASRARHGTRLYVAVATDPGPVHPPEIAGSAAEVLTAVIRRSGVEPSALEAVQSAISEIGSLRRMACEYEYALGQRVGDCYRRAAESVCPGITDDPAWPVLTQRLHLAEAAGMDPAGALRRAEQLGDFTAAHSVTAVTAARLDRLLTRAGMLGTPGERVPWWLAAPPPPAGHLTRPWDEYLPARYQEMAARIEDLLLQTRTDRPSWLSDLRLRGGLRDTALRHVLAYRSVYDIHSDDPIGPEPTRSGRQRQAWRATHDLLLAARDGSGPTAAERLLDLFNTADDTSTRDVPGPTRAGPTLRL